VYQQRVAQEQAQQGSGLIIPDSARQ
jgi:hypothetical protein